MLPSFGMGTASLRAERMCEWVRNNLLTPKDTCVTTRLGVASLELKEGDQEMEPITARDLINNADKALYQSKHNGRDRVATFTETIQV